VQKTLTYILMQKYCVALFSGERVSVVDDSGSCGLYMGNTNTLGSSMISKSSQSIYFAVKIIKIKQNQASIYYICTMYEYSRGAQPSLSPLPTPMKL